MARIVEVAPSLVISWTNPIQRRGERAACMNRYIPPAMAPIYPTLVKINWRRECKRRRK